MKRTTFSAAQIGEMGRLHAYGYSGAWIARRFGISKTIMRRVAREHGFPLRTNQCHSVMLVGARAKEALGLRRAGLTYSALAERMGTRWSMVRDLCVRNGEPYCPRGLGKEAQSTAKATERTTARRLAWAAGFIEGEGHFNGSLSRGVKNYVVGACQVNKEPVERLLRLFGGTLRQRPAPENRPECQPQWKWTVNGSRARGVMFTLYALMSARRRQQILVALGRI